MRRRQFAARAARAGASWRCQPSGTRISAEGANDANAGECVMARARRASSKAREAA